MDWAEEFGIGEMGLAPDVFWALTKPEFDIKHRAWKRAEDRQRALMIEHGLMTGGHRFKKADQTSLRRDVTALRRYPMLKMPQEDDA
jgi:hypothetical protein